ncbi:hypothetical protein VTJ83DRAFT_596 [Remersonia thermophila]|uniref:Uncharacterized protein n=1 Tax=Remersonia thermophila TaxID=72144 RepID=A0ABR4DLH7_9PEZI
MGSSRSLTASAIAAILLAAGTTSAQSFTIANGQIFTPGLVIVNAPQPGTPLGGEFIEVALDVTANGRLPLPPYPEDSPSMIHKIDIFLSSYDAGRNFTITNGTASLLGDALGNIMEQEPGSTVKHVKWVWPACLAGDGVQADNKDRGTYNVSIRQSFRLNGQDHYTVFDLPISVTNSIPPSLTRPPCDELDNDLLTPEEIAASSDETVGILFAPGDATVVETVLNGAATRRAGLGWAAAGLALGWMMYL